MEEIRNWLRNEANANNEEEWIYLDKALAFIGIKPSDDLYSAGLPDLSSSGFQTGACIPYQGPETIGL